VTASEPVAGRQGDEFLAIQVLVPGYKRQRATQELRKVTEGTALLQFPSCGELGFDQSRWDLNFLIIPPPLRVVALLALGEARPISVSLLLQSIIISALQSVLAKVEWMVTRLSNAYRQFRTLFYVVMISHGPVSSRSPIARPDIVCPVLFAAHALS
jgi:hypothetical protein